MKVLNCVGAIICDNDKILVIQQEEGTSKGMWEFPNGKINLGENPECALVRKIKEEFSVQAKVGEWVGTVEYDYPTVHLVMKIYLCNINSKKMNMHRLAKWITLDEINELEWNPVNKQIFTNIEIEFKWKIQHRHLKDKYKGDYCEYVFGSSKTLKLMDNFEGIIKGSNGPYKRFILKNTHEATVGNYILNYHLIIERYPDIRHTEGNITFSKFKDENGVRVYNYCDKQLRNALKLSRNILKKKEFYFYIPYYLRAQNSKNREGYGWEWDWSYGIGFSTEGTFYGETDNYAFVGVVIESVKKKVKPVKSKPLTINYKVELIMFQGKKYYKVYKSEEESFLIPYKEGMSERDALEIFCQYQ